MSRLLIGILLALIACERVDPEKEIPRCLKKEIRNSRSGVAPSAVWEYNWKGETFFLFLFQDCCDQADWVLDMHCNFICSPSGGFAGNGDGRCPDFYKEATQIALAWTRD